MDKQLATIGQLQSAVINQAVSFGPRLVVALLILVAGYYAGAWVGRFLRRMLQPFGLEPALNLLLVRIARIAVLALFGVLALQNLGVQLLPLIAGLGVAGAGVALAMQGLLSNFVAGFVIIFSRPFRVGQYISIAGVEGKVEEISLFSTILGHADLSRVVIPNRKIVGEILHNYGHIRQLDLGVHVAYDTDLGQALATLQQILCDNSCVLQEPAPLIQVTSLKDSSVQIGIKPWVNVPDYARVSGEINQAVLERFRGEGIVIPFPQREVRLIQR